MERMKLFPLAEGSIIMASNVNMIDKIIECKMSECVFGVWITLPEK